MGGWKTWAGAAIMAVASGLNYAGYTDLSKTFQDFAFAMLAVGLGHKLEKK